MKKSNLTKLTLVLTAILMVTVACIGSAQTVPTSSPDEISTVVQATIMAYTEQAAFNTPAPAAAQATSIPPTAVPPTAVPPTIPVIAPTQPLPAATRINFLTGATTGVVTAPIAPGQTQYYVLNAMQGQPMIVMVDSFNHDVTLSIKTQGGTTILGAGAGQSNWQGMLPTTEDYYIGVVGGATTENFTLSVEIPARIKFTQGTDKQTLTGQTAGGYNVAYTIFALKDQNMSVELTSPGNQAALTIYGFTDGQPYIRSVTGATTFDMKLPATQDYIIEVVPMAGATVNYSLFVQVK